MLRPPLMAGLLALASTTTTCVKHEDEPVKEVALLPAEDSGASRGSEDSAPAEVPSNTIVPPVAAEKAPEASPRKEALPEGLAAAPAKIESWFSNYPGQNVYLQIDKPLYQPGETIWVKSWNLRRKDLVGSSGAWARLQLVSPKGAVVLEKWVTEAEGQSTNDFELPASVQGGEYKIRFIDGAGKQTDRPLIVSSYEAPRVKKKLEFLRKAYGAGDEVSATVEVHRPTGEPLAGEVLTGVITLDGQVLPNVSVTTGDNGGAVVRFKLPATLDKGDGLLTVMVEEGGVTESITKRIPIVMKKVALAFYPEGGTMVQGLPTRVYFEAKNTLGKPADVEGRVVDDHGNTVATFKSHHHGLGRVEFTPATGRRYQAEITRPVGVVERYDLPLAAEAGCALRSFDDLDGQEAALRVAVRCTQAQDVYLVGTQRDQLIDHALVPVAEGAPTVVHLKASSDTLARAQGVARVTLFDANLNPLAERLVFRNRRALLGVEVKLDKEAYAPRDQVVLTVTTRDPAGAPIPAELALSVVDDTVVSFADDKTGHILSKLYLEPELPGEVEEPNTYFDLKDPKSALAMEMLMGTRGWRRFEWRTVWEPPQAEVAMLRAGAVMDGGVVPMRAPQRRVKAAPMADALEMAVPMAAPPPAPAAPAMAAAPQKNEARRAEVDAPADMEMAGPPVAQQRAEDKPMPGGERAAAKEEKAAGVGRAQLAQLGYLAEPAGGLPAEGAGMKDDADWAGDELAKKKIAAPQLAPVRVFPAPVYSGAYDGPRTDFRQTIHWAPTVRTGKDGRATVTFYLSDAITSFRVFTEGVGQGAAGRDETVFESSLPFSMSVKLPTEVSAGDKLLLPLTLTNEKSEALPIDLAATFGEGLSLDKEVRLKSSALAAGSSESLYYPVTVTGTMGAAPISFAATAGGLKDEFTRQLSVVPVGFPLEAGVSGEVADRFTHRFDLGEATPGTVAARITFYPSPLSTMVSGLEGILRQPSGCFEQASSTTYPNIMVMQYMSQHNVADAALAKKAGDLIDDGYKRLSGYETAEKGYEWFGSAPGHEALSAYGLLEFSDMKQVYGDVDAAMMDRTAKWLMSRRDGKGGYKRNDRALDSFGAASPEVTDAYITWALTEAGYTDLPEEIERSAQKARGSKDPYVLALTTATLYNVPSRKGEADSAAARLASIQSRTGQWTGADHSITRSGGLNLEIETTSLALLALMDGGGHEGAVREGISWLQDNRGGFGQWGATQATVLALKAMTVYADKSRATPTGGTLLVKVGGKKVGEIRYEAGRREPLILDELGRYFTSGANDVEILHEGGRPLPFSVAVTWNARLPASSPDVVVDLKTSLARSEVKMGETVRLTATVANKTQKGQPMTLVRVGVPAGLTYQTWQLKELKDKGLVGFWETRPREVILYLRDMKPGEVKEIPLDLVAVVPGEFKAPASSTYLYYTDEDKAWVEGVGVVVRP